jgi:hypothetical protein
MEVGMNRDDISSEAQEASDQPKIKMYQDIVDRAHAEVEAVRKVYYHFAGLIGIIITVGIGAFTIVSYKSIHEMKTDMKEEVQAIKSKASQDYTNLEASLKIAIERDSQDVRKKVDSRIDAEFDKDNVQGLVRDKAQERIDKIADPLINKQVDTKITPRINSALRKLGDVENSVEFTSVISAVLNDDKVALDRLLKWVDDKNHPLHKSAEQALKPLLSKIKTDYVVASFDYPWKQDIDMVKLTLLEIQKNYPTGSGMQILKSGLIHAAYNSEVITPKDKLMFFAHVVKTDGSIEAIQSAIKFTNLITSQAFDISKTNSMIDWYENNISKLDTNLKPIK